MSNFDNGFAVGYVLGKKSGGGGGGGGGPCPPIGKLLVDGLVATNPKEFSYDKFLSITNLTLNGTANSDYSSSYTIEPA